MMPIYFAQATEGGGAIKVGFSDNVPARIKQLEAHYGRPLAVLATLPGGREEEREIHERFASLRFGKTEQFRPDPELLTFIGRPLFVSACPVVEAMEARPSGRDGLIAVKCWRIYKDWVERFAKRRRTTPSQLIDIALLNLAEADGFEPPPDR